MRKMYSKKQIEEIAKSSGTKLYKHLIFDNNMGYSFILITTNSQPIDFSIINNDSKLLNYLQTENVISFTIDGYPVIYDEIIKQHFYTLSIRLDGNIPTCVPSYYEDIDYSATTDTITPL